MATLVAPVIASFSSDSNIVGDGITNSNRLTLSGTATPNTTINLFDGTVLLGIAAVGAAGTWSFNTATLSNGAHNFTASDADGAGNISAPSSALTITVDTIAPAQPSVSSWSPDSVNNTDYGVTNSNHLTFNGSAEANSLVTVYDNGAKIGTTTASSAGTWAFATGAVSDGINAFTFSATDAAGNSSGPTYFATHAIVDAATPTTPTLVGGAQIGVMMEGAESSWIGFPGTTDLDYLKSHGVDLIRLPIAWELMQNTLNGPLNATYLSGLETFLNEAAQRGMKVIIEVHNHGEYDPTWQQDMAAHGGLFSSAWQIGQPIGSSAVPVSAFADFWTKLSTALSSHAGVGGFDLMNEPAYISGTTWQTAAQSAVDAIRAVDTKTPIYVEGASWSVASTWQLPWYSGNLNVTDPVNNLTYEAHQYFDANSTGLYQQAFNPQTDYTNMGVDLLQPWINWLQANNAKGFLGEFGAPVTDPRWLPIVNAVLDDLQENGISATYCNYTYKQSAGISIDPEVNQGGAMMEVIFEHSAPSIAGFVPTNGAGNGGTTSANILTLNGTGASFCTVKVFNNGTLIGTTTSDVSGAWSLTTATLANGMHNFTATNIDAAGNSSEISFTLMVTVAANGLTAPAITNFSDDSGVVGDHITNDNTLTLTGTAEAGATVKIYDGATLLNSVIASGTGVWSYTTAALANGAHNLTATATDTAGNTSAASTALSVTVDTTAPIAPTITSFSNDSGAVGDHITNDNTLTLTGTAEAGATVKIYDGATLLNSVTASGTGAWSYTTGVLSDGAHSLTATATDVAGNTGPASTALSVTVDTAAPIAPTITSFSNDSGAVGDHITNDNTLTLTGTAEAGATVKVYDGATLLNSVTASGTGAWSYTTAALANGAHNLTVTATDTAGNTSPASTALSVTVDTTAPNVTQTAAVPSNTVEFPGDTVTITLTLSEVAVVSGTPTLALNTGGTAAYSGGTGTNVLTFIYTVGGSDSTVPALTVTAVNLPNGATISDVAGNTANLSGALTTFTGLQIDPPVAPSAPTIASFSADSGVLGDHITNDNTLTLTGTAEAGATVKIYDGATLLNSVIASGTGVWSYTTAALANGAHNLTATATDTAGNTSAASTALSVTVDTTAPIAPTITSFSNDSGAVGDHITNDNTLTLTGTAEAGATVKIYDGATLLNSVTASGTGAWSYTTGVLSDGAHSLTATATDVAGNTGPASTALSVTVDTAAPIAPTITSFSNDSGAVGDHITNDNTLTLTGTAEAGATVKVYDGATLLNSVTASGTGAWSYTTAALANGAHNLTVTATDTAGNTSPASTALSVTVDTTAPNVTQTAAVPSNTVEFPGDTVTITLTLSEVAVVSGTPTLALNTGGTAAYSGGTGTNVLTFIYTVGGSDSTVPALTVTAVNLPNGATISDVAGNTANLSGALTTFTGLQIDPPVAPSAPTIASFSADSGVLGDHITNDNTLTLTGTAEAGATVKIYDGATLLNSVIASGTGVWSYTTAALANGAHNLTATATDTAGNTGASSSTLSVTIDTKAPVVTQTVATPSSGIEFPSDKVTVSLTLSEAVTVSGTPTLSLNDGGTATYTSGSGTNTLTFSYTVGAGDTTVPALAVIAANLSGATIIDAAGNSADLSAALVTFPTLQIDPPTVLTAPTISSFSTDSGVIGDHITKDNTLTLTGKAEVGSAVKIYDGATLLGSVKASTTGAWSYTTVALADGGHNLTATATDAAGNTGAASSVLAVTIDTTAPVAPAIASFSIDSGVLGDNITNDKTLTLTGTAEAGATVRVYDGAKILGSVGANSDGAWSYTSAALANGAHHFSATATDAAGNTSAATTGPGTLAATTSNTLTITIDATAPVAPTIVSLLTDSGVLGDHITNDTTPTLAGKAAANATIKVYDGTTFLGSTTASATGAWSFTATSALTDGAHNLTATATDEAGNTGIASSAFRVNIDTAAPVAPTIATFSTDSGIKGDGITNDNTLTLSGTAEAGATVKVYDGATLLGSVRAGMTGAWAYTTAPLTNGGHNLTTTATDAAGNTGVASSALAVTVIVPTITAFSTDSGVAGDHITNDKTLALAGTAEANATVHVYDGTRLLGSTSSDASGHWNFTTAALNDAKHSLIVTDTDSTGVTSSPSAALPIIIDTRAPVAPRITAFSTDSGVLGDHITNDSMPTLSGKAEAFSDVKVYDGATLLGQATASAGGIWSLTTASTLTDGAHNLTATATDAAGNTGMSSSAFRVNIDTTAPVAPSITAFSIDTGVLGDHTTSDNTPTLTGTAEANSTIKIYEGATLLGSVKAGTTGAWSYTTHSALTDGMHNLTATATDAAGNASAMSAVTELTITAPALPEVLAVHSADIAMLEIHSHLAHQFHLV